jgi:hypothetical protein
MFAAAAKGGKARIFTLYPIDLLPERRQSSLGINGYLVCCVWAGTTVVLALLFISVIMKCLTTQRGII